MSQPSQICAWSIGRESVENAKRMRAQCSHAAHIFTRNLFFNAAILLYLVVVFYMQSVVLLTVLWRSSLPSQPLVFAGLRRFLLLVFSISSDLIVFDFSSTAS